ncbi:MAG: DUF4860 domain-containing protein [Lachnospiraceae bacterium]|nr:DUF4860 domain-containing protein [Lachnospiraceae bacterium]
MSFGKRDRSIVDVLFILALFAVFMLCSMFIVLFGAKIYKRVVADSDVNFSARTTQAYITEKVRSHDHDGGIEVIYDDGGPVLKLNESYDGTVYCTYLYEDDGYIKEITSSEEYDPAYHMGQKILAVKSFDVDMISPSLLKFYITDTFDEDYVFYSAVNSGGPY